MKGIFYIVVPSLSGLLYFSVWNLTSVLIYQKECLMAQTVNIAGLRLFWDFEMIIIID